MHTRAMIELFPTRLSPMSSTACVFILGRLSHKFGFCRSRTKVDEGRLSFVFVFFFSSLLLFPFFSWASAAIFERKVSKSCFIRPPVARGRQTLPPSPIQLRCVTCEQRTTIFVLDRGRDIERLRIPESRIMAIYGFGGGNRRSGARVIGRLFSCTHRETVTIYFLAQVI